MKKLFNSPYLGIDTQIFSHLFTQNGDYSVIIGMHNPVAEYASDYESYTQFHQLTDNIIHILGPGHTLQKLDIFNTRKYRHPSSSDFLAECYFSHFTERSYAHHVSYLVLTKNEKRNRLFVSDPSAFENFLNKVKKIVSVLDAAGTTPMVLDESSIKKLIRQMLCLHFEESPISYHNLACRPSHMVQGGSYVKSTSLIDADQVNLPPSLQAVTHLQEPGFPLPVDLMHFLSGVHGYQSMIYHQAIIIPNQESTFNKLRMKRKRHMSIPDPANLLSVKDIDSVLDAAAQSNLLLVRAHFNILIKADPGQLNSTCNGIESQLFKLGITPSANDGNQLELFRAALPGNSGELKSYNQFLTSSDAAVCLLYKERRIGDEDSNFKIHLSDRSGIPVALDTNDLPMQQGRINNRNKFVLGPSGSGKSFFMNHLVRQYFGYDMDIVLVDTGHSYEGLCRYFNGQYITYSEEKPITMNPFNITAAEFNEEKREFLKALIGLLWKGADGTLNQIEDTMLAKVIRQYYDAYRNLNRADLNFNSFYEFSVRQISEISKSEVIPFDLETYRFVLKKFYKGGHYDSILNRDTEQSLFDAPFIVFEIDAIKEHKILFPITTLIIMDVFLQKMRMKANRKCLIIEEAWKAIASPMMAGYILYLYKTIRKFRGEAIVVTQELDDIIGNKIVKDSIISNSDCLCLLDQSKFKDHYEDIAKLLSLNETEQRKIFSINKLDNKDGRGRFKEVYIKRGATGEVYGVEVSLEEYLTYTTERAEKEAVQRYFREYKDYKTGIRTFVRDFHKSGLSLHGFVESGAKSSKVKGNG
jgi:conjugation system TraG family ATPase